MIAEGKQISASTALLYGLIDDLVEGDLDQAHGKWRSWQANILAPNH